MTKNQRAKKDKLPVELAALLAAHEPEFADMVLEYARTLEKVGKPACYDFHSVAMETAVNEPQGPGKFIIAGPLPKIKEETNIDYIPHHHRGIYCLPGDKYRENPGHTGKGLLCLPNRTSKPGF